jgi:hypothetical protein
LLLLGRTLLLLDSALVLGHWVVVLDNVVQREVARGTSTFASPARFAPLPASVLQLLGGHHAFSRPGWLASYLALRGLLLHSRLLLNRRVLLSRLRLVADVIVGSRVAGPRDGVCDRWGGWTSLRRLLSAPC